MGSTETRGYTETKPPSYGYLCWLRRQRPQRMFNTSPAPPPGRRGNLMNATWHKIVDLGNKHEKQASTHS